MKLAIVGSRGITLSVEDLSRFVPEGVSEIVSGGAIGVDRCAAAFARARGIKLTEFLPDYEVYGHSAPIRRNEQIADYADEAIAFWDGVSRGTVHTIKFFRERGKRVRIFRLKKN